MKINDIIFRYSFSNNWKRDGICRVRTFVNSKFQLITLITELDLKNTSDSITNSIEVICESLMRRLIVPKQSIFIEHYEPCSVHNHTFSIVRIEKNKETSWEDIDFIKAKSLIECEDDEFNIGTSPI